MKKLFLVLFCFSFSSVLIQGGASFYCYLCKDDDDCKRHCIMRHYKDGKKHPTDRFHCWCYGGRPSLCFFCEGDDACKRHCISRNYSDGKKYTNRYCLCYNN